MRNGIVASAIFVIVMCLTNVFRSPAISAAEGNSVTLGEFVVDPPTLINLGFEWFIQGDDNRNATVEVSYRKQGDTQWKPALPLLRLQGERIKQGDQLDVIVPEHVRRQHSRPRAGHGVRGALRQCGSGRRGRREDEDGDRADAAGAPAVRGRPRLSRLSAGLQGRQKLEPSFDGLMCAYNYTCAGTDWATAGRPRVRAGRHDPGSRRRLQVQPLRIHERRHGQSHGAARRHVLPDRGRHARHADRDQGRGRRRGDLRRRRQLRAVRRAGRRLHLFRRHHVPQCRLWRFWPARSSSPARKA